MTYLYDNLSDDLVNKPFSTLGFILKELQLHNIKISFINDQGEKVNFNTVEFLLLFFDKGLYKIDNLIKNNNIKISLDKISYSYEKKNIGLVPYYPELSFKIMMPDIYFFILRGYKTAGWKLKRMDKNIYKLIVNTYPYYLDANGMLKVIANSIQADLGAFLYRKNLSRLHRSFKSFLDNAYNIDFKDIEAVNKRLKDYVLNINKDINFTQYISFYTSNITKNIDINTSYKNNTIASMHVFSSLKLFMLKNTPKQDAKLRHIYMNMQSIKSKYLSTEEELVAPKGAQSFIKINIQGEKCCLLKLDENGIAFIENKDANILNIPKRIISIDQKMLKKVSNILKELYEINSLDL